MITLGIDIALRNEGICCLNNKSIIHHERFIPESSDFYHPAFLVEHKTKLLGLLLMLKPDLVAVEGGSLSSMNWQMSIGELFGLYSLVLYEHKIPTVILPPMKWKKIFTGRGDASKARIREVAMHNFEYHPEGRHRVSQDEYDATGIAFIGYLCAKIYKGYKPKLDKQILKLFLDEEKGILKDKYLSYNLDVLDSKSLGF